jgi:hypothetical protein
MPHSYCEDRTRYEPAIHRPSRYGPVRERAPFRPQSVRFDRRCYGTGLGGRQLLVSATTASSANHIPRVRVDKAGGPPNNAESASRFAPCNVDASFPRRRVDPPRSDNIRSICIPTSGMVQALARGIGYEAVSSPVEH